MPTQTNDRNLNAAYALTLFSIPLEYHILTSVSLYDQDGGSNNNEIFAELGLFVGINARHVKLAVLASGLMGGRFNLGWTGQLPTEPGMAVYCAAYGPDDRDVRLAATLWKIVATEDGRFVLDP
jgi:hypothetical protein